MPSTKNQQYEIYKENFRQMKKLPFVQFLLKENRLLKKENAELKDTVVKLCRKVLIKEEPIEVKKENIVYEIEEEDPKEEIISVSDVVLNGKTRELTVENSCLNNELVEDDTTDSVDEVEVEETADAVEEEEEVEEEEDVEEEEVEEEEEEVEEEEVEEEEEEVEEEEVEEEVVEEEVVEEEEDEVVEEVDVVEEEEEEEDEVVEEEEEEEEEVYEVKINSKIYYVMNEVDSVIYELDSNGDISIEAGKYKNGKPVFNKK